MCRIVYVYINPVYINLSRKYMAVGNVLPNK